MTTFSVHVPFMPVRAEQIAPVAELVRWADHCRLWLGQSLSIEPHQMFAYCVGLRLGVPVGTSVTLMPLRHPYEAAVQARSLAQITGQPVVAGYGPGPADLQRALLGTAYRKPLTAVREYVTAVRGLLDGDAVGLAASTSTSKARCCRCPIHTSTSDSACCGPRWPGSRARSPTRPSPGSTRRTTCATC
jgi:alkanesulfonate monooxygenase SsuD/methylene tetrahydromethanopterin reductase-like flavin-dependent oxidoreductase (luciferase family)